MNKLYLFKSNQEISFDNDNQCKEWFMDNTTPKGEMKQEALLYKDFNLGVTEMTNQVCQEFGYKDSDYLTINMIDGSLSRDKIAVLPSGWQLQHYVNNPVILWSHSDNIPAIGRMHNTRMVGGVMIGEAEFVPKELDEFAFNIGERLRTGFLSKGSVGFIPIKIDVPKDRKSEANLVISEQELYEYSIVNVPNIRSSGVVGKKVKNSFTKDDNGESEEQTFNLFDKSNVKSDYIDTLFKGTRKDSELGHLFKSLK